MLKWLALLIGTAHAQAVNTQQYLIYNDSPTCLQRSQQQCAAMGCDGVNTIYWWDCSIGPLKSGLVGPTAVSVGSYGMRVEQSGPFAKTYSTPRSGGPQGLLSTEQTKLVSPSQIAPVLPPPIALQK